MAQTFRSIGGLCRYQSTGAKPTVHKSTVNGVDYLFSIVASATAFNVQVIDSIFLNEFIDIYERQSNGEREFLSAWSLPKWQQHAGAGPYWSQELHPCHLPDTCTWAIFYDCLRHISSIESRTARIRTGIQTWDAGTTSSSLTSYAKTLGPSPWPM